MDVIERDRHIYRKSGGGITCTGGEPLLQMEFVRLLLAECSVMGIRTALETCGYVDEAEFRKTLSNVDWLFFDLKHLDSNRHRGLTGRDNSIVLSNLRTASSVFSESGRVLVIRQVIVPGLNDGNNISALAEFARALPHVNMIELLPYHAYGSHKYRSLGREYQLHDLEPPSEDRLLEYKDLVERQGIQCKIGGL
jgi:pyruvate formate lyase activating enzyme